MTRLETNICHSSMLAFHFVKILCRLVSLTIYFWKKSHSSWFTSASSWTLLSCTRVFVSRKHLCIKKNQTNQFNSSLSSLLNEGVISFRKWSAFFTLRKKFPSNCRSFQWNVTLDRIIKLNYRKNESWGFYENKVSKARIPNFPKSEWQARRGFATCVTLVTRSSHSLTFCKSLHRIN